ncbi:Uncharacterised protein [Chryseobacterium gleum]|uniref:Uncharacterized protein n=2 Tax=Chryseobacterium gleum TaxID=250 RepID=A0A3S4NXI8_CHRGE|nr:hypothetical protein [Chryseobacterium gleum]EFK36804.1 hypothetical protein HMPREF0204_11361 [Chryseobacterium gleum ATCC 35910]QQY32059.1 hypothetical protein I6I60_25060 [Chryseobacterium gleum]VEE10720.1 Uncharacterised protein [Chryseobacterium gleum]
MDKKELRIGNLIKYNGYEYTVKTIEDDLITVEELEEAIEYYKPVELTSVWLDKFGFEKCSNSWYKSLRLTDSLYIMIDRENHTWITQYEAIDHYAIQIESLKYVHQLQNLYFFMSFGNNELEYSK